MSFLAKIFGKKKSHTEENKQELFAVSDVRIRNPEERTREDLIQDLAIVTHRDPKTGKLMARAPKNGRKYLKETLDCIERVQGGKEMLDNMAKDGYRILFTDEGKKESEREEYCGKSNNDKWYGNPKVVTLSLDDHVTTAGLALSLINIMSNIEQRRRLKAAGIEEENLNMADQIRLDRAQTVARYALEAELVVQMSKIEPNDEGGLSLTLPDGLKQVFAIHPPIKAYAQEMLNTAGDRGKSVEKVADSFCETTHNVKYYRNAYEEGYIKCILTGLNNASADQPVLQKSLTPEEMIKLSFEPLFQGSVSPDILKSKQMNSLSKNALGKLQAISEECEKAGIKDESFKQLYPHNLKLSYNEVKKLDQLFERRKEKEAKQP